MLSVACVLTGDKYSVDFVTRLAAMVKAHLDRAHDFICFTDRGAIADWPKRVWRVDVSALELPGWWAKMALFNPAIRGAGRTLYFDLDTVIVGDLAPLAAWQGDFGICQNFTQLAGHATWPCRFGSCVMSFDAGWGLQVWEDFERDRDRIMAASPRGDQEAIEALVPGAPYLQDALPGRFFLHYRALKNHWNHPPQGTAVVVFGGRHNPDNFGPPWSRAAWRKAKT